MSSVSIGDVYLVSVRYQDDPTSFKDRPVVVVAISSDSVMVVCAAITSVGPHTPEKYYDKFKFAIQQWAKANLTKPSWVKTHPANLLRLQSQDLTRRIGTLHPDDLLALINFMIESSEEF
ncbi:mRNA interferase MazF [Alicyclobacillus sacchari]|uniref:mRNA interferase MazF n=1 Tax=Alicyclobacillus sacchari TaxID=392010 RepID=A0A4R8LGA8_9BACL|nr:type II toxin-antitoxin system PemK/MazF family toxin [Alicyclobacillus sacchari]TDY42137.1 mRNA interferase MazF [Alicyclobacillus sacchari]GMA59254.1 hypothetical protein GCM10025858_37570 [Alicyclobacillus sacchari]GMA59398.1 hypothetical protein GCM10025858_39010 [Alicyclobacillus sacchari]